MRPRGLRHALGVGWLGEGLRASGRVGGSRGLHADGGRMASFVGRVWVACRRCRRHSEKAQVRPVLPDEDAVRSRFPVAYTVHELGSWPVLGPQHAKRSLHAARCAWKTDNWPVPGGVYRSCANAGDVLPGNCRSARCRPVGHSSSRARRPRMQFTSGIPGHFWGVSVRDGRHTLSCYTQMAGGWPVPGGVYGPHGDSGDAAWRNCRSRPVRAWQLIAHSTSPVVRAVHEPGSWPVLVRQHARRPPHACLLRAAAEVSGHRGS